MSKPKTLRVVPQSQILTADSSLLAEGKAVDVPTADAERLISMGHAVEVLKSEVEEGAPVQVLPAPAEAEPARALEPEPVQVELPPVGKKAK
ncbi:hypothetical protein [Roseomonas chloroacetimidivorans]|uniref:hypothetical protein n=1 Tax=Roseomonas chloroacetimidivorans TaxID=1766656 RepID=UPI003C73FAD2